MPSGPSFHSIFLVLFHSPASSAFAASRCDFAYCFWSCAGTYVTPHLRLSTSALMGDPDPYPWVFFYLLLQPRSLKDPSYGLPIPMDPLPIGAWVPMGYSYRWILIGTYRYTYGYLCRGYIIDVHLLII